MSVLTIIGAGLACKRDREGRGRKERGKGETWVLVIETPVPTTVLLSINVSRGQECGPLYHQQFNRLPFAGWHHKYSPLLHSTVKCYYRWIGLTRETDENMGSKQVDSMLICKSDTLLIAKMLPKHSDWRISDLYRAAACVEMCHEWLET